VIVIEQAEVETSSELENVRRASVVVESEQPYALEGVTEEVHGDDRP
jgi:hypothetical protein